jgi:prolyl-tRNA editing enzyme YbaK/EbsC (Cys-tRNA(Pro) deacylase)
MWPDSVERIASFLRAAGVQGRLEELPAGVDSPPGPTVRAVGFECDGRVLVALVLGDRTVDRDKLARAARCGTLRPATAPGFPFQPARVFVDRGVLADATVWLEAGSPRHVLGLSPSQLARLTRSETVDLLTDD